MRWLAVYVHTTGGIDSVKRQSETDEMNVKTTAMAIAIATATPPTDRPADRQAWGKKSKAHRYTRLAQAICQQLKTLTVCTQDTRDQTKPNNLAACVYYL